MEDFFNGKALPEDSASKIMKTASDKQNAKDQENDEPWIEEESTYYNLKRNCWTLPIKRGSGCAKLLTDNELGVRMDLLPPSRRRQQERMELAKYHQTGKNFSVPLPELDTSKVCAPEKTKNQTLRARAIDYEELKYDPNNVCAGCNVPMPCRSMQEVHVSHVLKYAQPGDVILYNNKSTLGTCLVKVNTRSSWDHCGIVVRRPGAPQNETYLLEALAPTVHLDLLMHVIEWVLHDGRHMSGKDVLYWRPLIHPGGKTEQHPNGKPSDYFMRQLWREALFYSHNFGADKETSAIFTNIVLQDAICWKSTFGDRCCGGVDQYESEDEDNPHKQVFCSELAAKLLMKGQAVKKVLPSATFLPKDVSNDPHSKLAEASSLWNDGYGAGIEMKIVEGDEEDATAFAEYLEHARAVTENNARKLEAKKKKCYFGMCGV